MGCQKKKSLEQATVVSKKAGLSLTDLQMKFIRIDTVKHVPAAEQFTAVGEVSFASSMRPWFRSNKGNGISTLKPEYGRV